MIFIPFLHFCVLWFRKGTCFGDKDMKLQKLACDKYWLTHLWSPLTWWVSLLFCTLAPAPARAQAQHQHRKYQLGYLDSTENSTQQYWPSLDLTIHSGIFVGQPLITTGLVVFSDHWLEGDSTSPSPFLSPVLSSSLPDLSVNTSPPRSSSPAPQCAAQLLKCILNSLEMFYDFWLAFS